MELRNSHKLSMIILVNYLRCISQCTGAWSPEDGSGCDSRGRAPPSTLTLGLTRTLVAVRARPSAWS